MLTLYRVSTGENWEWIMFDYTPNQGYYLLIIKSICPSIFYDLSCGEHMGYAESLYISHHGLF